MIQDGNPALWNRSDNFAEQSVARSPPRAGLFAPSTYARPHSPSFSVAIASVIIFRTISALGASSRHTSNNVWFSRPLIARKLRKYGLSATPEIWREYAASTANSESTEASLRLLMGPFPR